MELLRQLANQTPAYVTPNHLSWFRIWVIPILWIAYLVHPALATMLYIVACVTDWLDGHLARTRGLITPSGKRLDEVSDKVLALGVLALLFATGTVPLSVDSGIFWCVAIIVVRECVITTLRERFSYRARLVPSLFSAKLKTALMMVAFGFLLPSEGSILLEGIGSMLLLSSLAFALYSGTWYVILFVSTRSRL